MSKFLVIPSDSNPSNRLKIANSLIQCAIFNYGVIFVESGSVKVEVSNHFTQTTQIYSKINRFDLANTIFPDKLNNLNGYEYKAYSPFVFTHFDKPSGETTTKYSYFLNSVAKIQNAKVNLQTINVLHTKLYPTVVNSLIRNRLLDLKLNEMTSTENLAPKLQLYEETNICALIPRSRLTIGTKSNFFPQTQRQMHVMIPLVGAVIIIWRLYRGRGADLSLANLILAIVAFCCDQGAKLGRNRMILTILLQILVIMLFFRNIYFGATITSNITVPSPSLKYNSFNDIYASEETVTVEPYVLDALNNSEAFKKMITQNRVIVFGTFNLNKKTDENVIIGRCISIDAFFEQKWLNPNDFNVLPEKNRLHLSQLEAGYLNPFLQRFQEYMNFASQGGLPQIWELMYKLNGLGTNEKKIVEDDEIMIRWKDIRVCFSILIVGHVLSFFVLLCEIFYHDFISRLSFGCVRRLTTNLARRTT